MVILSSLFNEKVASYQHVSQTGKPSSWERVFYLEFAFILWWLSARPGHGLHLDVICSCRSTDKRSLHTEKSAFRTGVMFL